ncbi:hypothetical protein [Streptomyces sp. SPB074]|uniref:hypothetical protein n=1 Tax=Streptomyces sp. (strain SPB074) TaxID=465543 RepID=UPI0001D1DDBE|nr:hypothetical protein [Streptomyces sp. SPB074]EFG64691.1 hypothetical protein SSBG_05481 [Streptomyces sp. SPB074]
MLVEAVGAAALGLVLAALALRRLPGRLPRPVLVHATGGVGGLFGAFVAHSSLGPGHLPLSLLAATAVTAALLSLLPRPEAAPERPRESATA